MAETITGVVSLNRRLTAVGGSGKNILGLLGLRVVREAKLRVARKTGNTGRTIHIASTTATTVRVSAGGAAAFLEHGTRPHIIRPKNGKALRWGATAADRRLSGRPRKNGNVRFAKVVHHPGTKAQPFMKPAVDVAVRQSGLAGTVVAAWNQAA